MTKSKTEKLMQKYHDITFAEANALDEKERNEAFYVLCLKQKEKLIDNNRQYREFPTRNNRCYAFFKRFFDIFSSFLALCALSLVFIIIAIAIKINDGGPILYKAIRIKKDGMPFVFYKFRSMYVGADKEREKLIKDSKIHDGPTVKVDNDVRITKVGKFLRKTSLDELPQLINILKGDMTVVGPRPCTHDEFLKYQEYPDAIYRLKVPQGLTGEWQANGRSNTNFTQSLEMDLNYIQNKRSFFYDIKLIFKTIIAVLKADGAE